MMYQHPATQANIALLKQRGAAFVGPGEGRLACGEEGPGRLIDTPCILEAAAMALTREKDLAGRSVLISSGANHEPIDPVRYIGNASSGRMGHALALEALCRGAQVCVIAGPSDVAPPCAAEVVKVRTAAEMHDAVMERLGGCHIFFSAAAVADYRVAEAAQAKMKRTGPVTLELLPNADIVAEAARRKTLGQVVAGFAAETENVAENGAKKLADKGLDLILANRVGGEDGAIGADDCEAWILRKNYPVEALGRVSKSEIARRLLDAAAGILSA